jgi:hypothetical protein
MHNEVNAMNDKPILSYEEAYNQIWKNTKKRINPEAKLLGTKLKLLLSEVKSIKK